MERQRKLKVYGGTFDGKHREVVAVTSGKKAATMFGISYNLFQQYGCETGNKKEIEAAMSQPGTVFIRKVNVEPNFREKGL